MFIQTEDTPNPNSLKFLPGHDVLGDIDPMFFQTGDQCSSSPFAKRILNITGVTAVMLGRDFITVTKKDEVEWYVLKPSILGMIMELFVNNLPVIIESNISSQTSDDDPIQLQIKEILDTRVRPAVAQDGGDIVFDSFKDGIVYLKMHGACSGCPSSSATLKSGIENMLRYYVPEVLEVRQIEA